MSNRKLMVKKEKKKKLFGWDVMGKFLSDSVSWCWFVLNLGWRGVWWRPPPSGLVLTLSGDDGWENGWMSGWSGCEETGFHPCPLQWDIVWVMTLSHPCFLNSPLSSQYSPSWPLFLPHPTPAVLHAEQQAVGLHSLHSPPKAFFSQSGSGPSWELKERLNCASNIQWTLACKTVAFAF